MEKSLDTLHHCTLRLAWVVDMYGLLTCEYAPVAYIDEKWFYKVNRRRAMKLLPKGKHENDSECESKLPKMLSRRFPVKTMFMAVVGRPLAHRNFDGKIHLERVSKTRKIGTRTSHHNFSDDVIVNDEIKSGSWKYLVSETDIYVFDLIHLLEETYNLEGYILD